MEAADTAPVNGVGRATVKTIFEQHRRGVFRAAYRITGNVEDAEDVLQTVFVNALRRATEGVGELFGEEPSRYLARAAINGALDVLRGRRAIADVDPESAERALETAPGYRRWRCGGRRLAGGVAGPSARSVIDLAPNWAEIVALRYFEGYSNIEIAVVLGTSPSAVGVTLHRARARLRAVLTASPTAIERTSPTAIERTSPTAIERTSPTATERTSPTATEQRGGGHERNRR